MTNKDLANIIFPNIDKDIEYYENLYPIRNLKEGAKVTRFAPSPTGYMHIGNLLSVVIDYTLAKNSEGVFFLRNEDTDQKREVEGAVDMIMHNLNHYNMMPDEYQINSEIQGEYGPYIQSKRKDIYHAFVKHLIQIGRAYPCFCHNEDIEALKETQKKNKVRTGYYGRYAKCRNITPEEAIKRINNGEAYVIRFKSEGNFDNHFPFDDLVKGKVFLPENDMDNVIMKSDGDKLPTYHFAHLVDDHLMRTTHVVRGEEWLPSVPFHLELFKAFNFKAPKYIHTPLIMKKDGDSVRKISKRKDPEFLMQYYEDKGYPVSAVIEAIMTIVNSNFEEWRTNNPDKPYYEFPYSPKKMSTAGAFFDLDKLENISKNIISKMKAIDLFNEYVIWTKKYDSEFSLIMENNKDKMVSFLNIEREQKKPRKDYACYSEIKDKSWYMFDEIFANCEKEYQFQSINDISEINNICNIYLDKYYNELDDKDTWFNKIKELSDEFGYAKEVKEYKENPNNYKGHVGDVSTVLRVAFTTQSMTPDLYEIMRLLGKENMKKRLTYLK